LNTEKQPPAGQALDGSELLRIIVESSTDFAIFAMDSARTVISWNIGAERLTGYAENEIVGRSGDVIFTPEDRDAGSPDREHEKALVEGCAEDERWHVRKDGSRFWGSGLMMPFQGGRSGFVKILRDRTEQHIAAENLRESEARFRMLATSIPQLVFRSRATGDRTWGSPQWEMYAGLSDGKSRGFGWLEALHPDDREPTVAAWRKAQQTGEYSVEHRIRRASDGEYRWHQTRARPIEGGDTGVTDWVGTSTDIHELRGLQVHQQILLSELQHRTRNLLAIVQGMANQTVRTSCSLEEFASEFSGRLEALARAQSLIEEANHGMIELGAIVEAELAACADGEKVTMKGDYVELPPKSIQVLALALHELGTNALKYGALRQQSGRLAVSWRVQGNGEKSRVVLDWRESGVTMPDNAATRRRGYGTELIECLLPYDLGAETRLEFGPDGVHCSITVPIEQ
jgi:PAS domain S-box-containing protein